MKALLISIKPKYVAKILNGKKTIEVRKRFPKDYKGWVYIYCTKSSLKVSGHLEMMKTDLSNGTTESTILNGKVVARFYCDKVEEIYGMYDELGWNYEFKNEEELLRKSCLDNEDLGTYLKICNNNDFQKVGYAIHISNLEIFDKPKELGEFKIKGFERTKVMGSPYGDLLGSVAYHYEKKPILKPLTKAPQSYCFIEVEE